MKTEPKVYTENGQQYRITATYALNYIRGNSAPYFSVTGDIRRLEHGHWREDSGGCVHEDIERHFPGQLTDLIALHLSDIYGAPMHAEVNGWYWLAGACGGLGERYHGGNAEYLRRTPLQIFMDHCRISQAEAEHIIAEVMLELGPINEANGKPEHTQNDYLRARNKWRDFCDSMRPRWKQEADAAIAKHGLTVTGDKWEQAA